MNVSSSPYCIARSLLYNMVQIGPGFPSFEKTYDLLLSISSKRSIGLITAAVPQAPASSKLSSSSSELGGAQPLILNLQLIPSNSCWLLKVG